MGFRAAGVVVLLLLAISCGPAPDLRSSRGTAIYLDGLSNTGMTVKVADAMEDFLVEGLVARGWGRQHLDRALSRAEIHFVPTPWHENGQLWGGSEKGSYLKVAVLTQSINCPWQGAYRHELAHWAQLDIRNQEDPQHQDPIVWKVANDWSMGCPGSAPAVGPR